MQSVPHPPTAPSPERVRTPPTAEAQPSARPMPGLRLRLKPKAPPTGYVDGGWWPRSRDLTVELPALVHVLAVRLGRVTRVAFALEAWGRPPRQLTVTGNPLRLEGFHSQDQYLLRVTGSDGTRLSLLVIPPEAAAAAAHDALMTASGRGNTDRPVEILAAGGIVPDTTVRRVRLVPDDLRSRWDTDGRQVQERG